MKYFFATLSLLLTLSVGVPFVHAQASCSPITSDNYYQCCPYNNDQTPQEASDCSVYTAGGGSTAGATAPTATATTTTNSCSPITSDNYYQCCPYNNDQTPQEATDCSRYIANGGNAAGATSASTNSPAPQQVNGLPGGTQASNPITPVLTGTNAPTFAPSVTTQNAINSCSAVQFTNLLNIAIWAKCVIGVVVIPGIFTLAFVIFLWGILKFMRASEQKDKDESKQYIITGLIGLFVMVSVWGILKIVNTTFGITSVVPALQTNALNTPGQTN